MIKDNGCDEFFKQILDNTNVWLHFAEAKNAAIITFNVAVLSAFFDCKFASKNYIFATIVIVLMLVSIVISLVSFIPCMVNNKNSICDKTKKTLNDVNDNLLFYKDIRNYDPVTYVEKVYNTYFKNISCKVIPKIHLDYAKEIIVNSRITMKKLNLFSIALYIDIAVIAFVSLLIIIA